uniref:MORN repeat-containing protein 5 n=1 Tax=Bactrocera dorsalis TaxID=27457 RepID=A0A034WKA0_BACDO
MQRSVKFCTGSNYVGIYNNPLNCMEGYGLYVYPDGSEYQGFFRRGRFHGIGRLTMAAPYSFTFIGEFDNGELTSINKMIYPDGLIFKADFNKAKLNTANWTYLSKNDRRYTRELCMDLPPVVPNEPVSRYSPRSLQPNTYDTEEGIYVEKSRFITKIPPPFYHLRFVNCDKEIDWIRQFCRHDDSDVATEPDEVIGRQILESNVRASTELGENLYTCTCNTEKGLQTERLGKFCRRAFHNPDDSSSSSQYSRDYKDAPSSMSTSSFLEVPIKLDMQTQCDNEVAQLRLKPNDLGPEYFS